MATRSEELTKQAMAREAAVSYQNTLRDALGKRKPVITRYESLDRLRDVFNATDAKIHECHKAPK